MMELEFREALLLRCPFYGAQQYSGELLQDASFRAALYLASPQLYAAVAKKEFDFALLTAKEQLSLRRYMNRMCFRPTPFGSFASFTLAGWGKADGLVLEDKSAAQLHLRLDREVVLREAAKVLADGFLVNPALYRAGKEFRFLKTGYSADQRHVLFDLESVERDGLTRAIVDSGGGSFGELVALVRQKVHCEVAVAEEYIGFLVEANILIADTAPPIIGGNRDRLRPVAFPDAEALVRLAGEIRERSGMTGNVFYAGLEREVAAGSLPVSYQQELKKALGVLAKLSRPQVPPQLAQFIRDFKQRYDRWKVPLLEAVDPDLGIGYGPAPAAGSVLLDQLAFKPPPENLMLEWSAAHRLLLERWTVCKPGGPLVLTAEDLAGLPDETLPAPPSLAVLFRLTTAGLWVESAGGASATALIGRFSAWSDGVHSLARELAGLEQAVSPRVIFADIGQLSDPHADNINRRLAIYDYELPVNTVSQYPADKQLALGDLWLSVAGNELVLESALMGKVVVPRLATAYNYQRNQLALFRLLGDLQFQGIQGSYSFALDGFFPGQAYYPRVVYEGTVLAPASWLLTGPVADLAAFRKLQGELGLPAWLVLSEADQQLVFNTDEEAEVLLLLDSLRRLERAVLHEYLSPVPLVSDDGGPLTNQFVAFLSNPKEVYAGTTAPLLKGKAKADFMPGSDWLYLKLYCSAATADRLLVKKLLPVLAAASGLHSWFFIRYQDPGYHIRLRLRLAAGATGPVLELLKKRLAGSVHYRLVRAYQADTYRRELERYGPDLISRVEDFFAAGSALAVHYLKAAGRSSFPYSAHSLAFVSVDRLISSFMPGPAFLEQMVQTFYAEFGGNKALKVGLDQKYRALKAELTELLARPDYYASLKLTALAETYHRSILVLIKAAAGFSERRRIQLLADLVHMHLNRLFSEQQRQQELIVYYCLAKHHRGRSSRPPF